jgi:hypothetical protein
MYYNMAMTKRAVVLSHSNPVTQLVTTLEITDLGDTEVRGGRRVISVEVRDRYLPDEEETVI